MSSYSDQDQITIDGQTVTLHTRKGSHGIRWGWFCHNLDLGSEGSRATAELAVADATATLTGPECRHGVPTTQFCPSCNDRQM